MAAPRRSPCWSFRSPDDPRTRGLEVWVAGTGGAQPTVSHCATFAARHGGVGSSSYPGGVLPVPVMRLDPDLPLPEYAHPGDAGLDLRAAVDVVVAPNGGRALVPTGIAVAIPAGHAGFVLPRSGNALNHGVTVANAPGLIDSAYRGELKVILLNTDPTEAFAVHRGDRIAQLVIQRVEEADWQIVDALDDNDRGGGFGHSGRT